MLSAPLRLSRSASAACQLYFSLADARLMPRHGASLPLGVKILASGGASTRRSPFSARHSPIRPFTLYCLTLLPPPRRAGAGFDAALRASLVPRTGERRRQIRSARSITDDAPVS